ncbi:MAG: monovalent cation/hydrogen antiporter [Alphaproteobacteria bacterium]|jgi:CPA1 family monovalent cation:H+ antiporter|nr:monovalent cation/hydrogen antiporter [Alphaproteobacteria bacterium]
MTETVQLLLLLLSVLVAVAILARRLNVAPSILLVIAGIGLALVPGLPSIELAPELVLLVILPPLLYSAAVAMSWREFRFNLRPIFLLAFGAVVFTTCAVAVAAHYVIGLPWAVGFLLGAIVSPPDAVAPLAVARRLRLPRRLLLVLEGEGVANDATALILYRFAVVAVSTGTFAFGEAAGAFAAIVVGEITWGVAVGWLSLRLRRWAREPRVEITLSLMTPYIAYWVPEHLGGSGVLATVAAGLYVSWRGPLLIPSATRLQGIFFWDLIIYLIEGFVFLVVGLQARTLLGRIEAYSLRDLAVAVALVTVIVILARFVWVFPAVYLPRWLSPSLARRDPSPPWEQAFVLAFVGVRGVVSLAAALAVPFLTAGGQVFPHRDLILFVTFGVIVVTLVGQGLMLPAVIRWLGLSKDAKVERVNEHEAELAARQDAIEAAYRRMQELLASREIPTEVAELLRLRHDHRRRQLVGDELRETVAELKLDLLRVEREFLFQLLREGRITDEARRRLERELDLEEAAIISRRGEESVLPL